MPDWSRYIIVTTVLLCSTRFAFCTDLDYLTGIGDFEKCSATKFFTDYTGSDYDFYARPGAIRIDSTTRKGFCDPLPDDSVADGWTRLVGGCSGPDKWNNIKLGDVVCRIATGKGVNGTNSQFIAIKGVNGSNAALSLTVFVRGRSFTPSAGDKLILRIDKMSFQDFSQVAVEFSANLTCNGQSIKQVLAPSTGASSAEVSLTLGSAASNAEVSIGISAKGDLGSHEPGIYIDGVHLFVRRAGESDNLSLEEVMPGIRGVRTIRTWYDTTDQSAVEVARNYDSVVLQASAYWLGAILKKVNPNIRVYCYQPVYAIDTRDMDGHSPYFSGTPIEFNTVLSHTDWLYAKPGGGYYGSDDIASTTFYMKLTSQSFRYAWAQGAINFAHKFGFDGVFVDTCADIQPPYSPPTRMPWEVQQFVHDVFSKLRAAGLDVIQNGSRRNRIKNPGENWWESGYVWHDIKWIPTASEVATGYSPNSTANISNGHYQEEAFFYCASASGEHNTFPSSYWLKCLADMDAVKQWNTAANAPSDNDKQWEHMHVWGRDDSESAAYGIDGWLQFGLCSYLLAQSDWTSFNWAIRLDGIGYSEPDLDLSITKKLGTPDGVHTANVGDAYCRWRRYKPNDDGGLGGVVVVNGNTTVTRTYTIDFDATDESGNIVTSGTKIKLKPHTGRIFLQRQMLDVKLSVPDDNVTSGQTLDVTVEYTNKGSTAVKDVTVQVQVPDQMSYVTGSAEKSGGRYYANTNTVVWTVKSVIARGTGTRTFRATVK